MTDILSYSGPRYRTLMPIVTCDSLFLAGKIGVIEGQIVAPRSQNKSTCWKFKLERYADRCFH
jgi:hypothetical protein